MEELNNRPYYTESRKQLQTKKTNTSSSPIYQFTFSMNRKFENFKIRLINKVNVKKENEELTKIYNLSEIKYVSQTCSFCNKKCTTKTLSTIDRELKFCDYICARLYDINVEKIELNEKEYRKYYIRNELSENSKKIYTICRNKSLFQLPVKTTFTKKENKHLVTLPITLGLSSQEIKQIKEDYSKLLNHK